MAVENVVFFSKLSIVIKLPVIHRKNIGRRALFSYRARLTSFRFSNGCTEERREVEFYYGV